METYTIQERLEDISQDDVSSNQQLYDELMCLQMMIAHLSQENSHLKKELEAEKEKSKRLMDNIEHLAIEHAEDMECFHKNEKKREAYKRKWDFYHIKKNEVKEDLIKSKGVTNVKWYHVKKFTDTLFESNCVNIAK